MVRQIVLVLQLWIRLCSDISDDTCKLNSSPVFARLWVQAAAFVMRHPLPGKATFKESLIESWHAISRRQIARFCVANFRNSRIRVQFAPWTGQFFTTICLRQIQSEVPAKCCVMIHSVVLWPEASIWFMIGLYIHEGSNNLAGNLANTLLFARFSPCFYCPPVQICSNRINRRALFWNWRHHYAEQQQCVCWIGV